MVAESSPKSSKDMVSRSCSAAPVAVAKRNNGAEMASALRQQAQVFSSAAAFTARCHSRNPHIRPKSPPPSRSSQPPAQRRLPTRFQATCACRGPGRNGLRRDSNIRCAFGLFSAPGTDVPLPMSRPAMPKGELAAEPALAYARTEDDGEDMPAYAKPTLLPGARAGVAIYDIAAKPSICPAANGSKPIPALAPRATTRVC